MIRLLIWTIRAWRRADRRYRECLKHIDALERELFPYLFEPENKKIDWLQDDLFSMETGAVWPVDSTNHFQITPQIAMQRLMAYAAMQYEEKHQQRELVSQGLQGSTLAAQLRDQADALRRAYDEAMFPRMWMDTA